jgi:NADH-quinone oxidoreductase subunit H
MHWPRGLVPVAVALVFLGLVAAASLAERVPPLELIRVADVTPRDVELGEPLSIAGEGFPAGQAARVTFRGVLHRPGETPQAGAEIVASGAVVAPNRVDVPFDENLQALFCRAGDRATHTTFDGAVEVAFRAAAPGQPPVAGTVGNVTLDVRPLTRPNDAARTRAGERLLSFWGIHAAAAPRQTGLLVESVDAGSRAAAAGIAPGDVVFRVDRVRVAEAGDVIPAPDDAEAVVGVRRSGSTEEATLVLPVTGWRAAPAGPLRGAVLFVVGALSIALLFGAPWPGRVDAALHRIVRGLRLLEESPASPGAIPARRSPRGAALRRLALQALLPSPGLPAVVEALALACLAVLPFGQYLVAARLDVGVLFVGAAALLATAAFVGADAPALGLRAALGVAWRHVPAAIALAGVVAVTGSLHVQEIERSQGGWPWEWLAFRSPASLLSCAIFVGATCAGPRASAARTGILSLVDAPMQDPQDPRPRRGTWADAAARVHRLVVCGLATALFLGGWSLPGVSAAQQDARPVLEIAGAALFSGKLGVLVVTAALLQRALAAGRPVAVRGWAAPWPLGLSLAATLVAAGWSSWGAARALQALVSPSLVVVAAALALAVTQRLRHGLRPSAVDVHLSPFL